MNDLVNKIEKVLGPLQVEHSSGAIAIRFKLGCVRATGTAVGFSPKESSIILLDEISAITLLMVNIDYFKDAE